MNLNASQPSKKLRKYVHENKSESKEFNIDLPEFRMKDFTDLVQIGLGSFGTTFHCKKDNQEFVIKEQVALGARKRDRKNFLKEVKILKLVSNHENIVNVKGFSIKEHAILLEYVCFNFQILGIERRPVSNLKEFLVACDDLDYKGFEHLQFFLANDIIRGLAFLHDNLIVHRDIKPENILVSNQNYIKCSNRKCWWIIKPIVAKLGDFGESRSHNIQTGSLTHSHTWNIHKGTLPYMAPELVLHESHYAMGINELKQIDIWALGMVMFHLLNPDAYHPFSFSINESSYMSLSKAMKNYYHEKRLPKNDAKYQNKQQTNWSVLQKMYLECCSFNPEDRPTARYLLHFIAREFLIITNLEITSEDLVLLDYLNKQPGIVQEATNVSTFINVILSDNFLLQKAEDNPLNDAFAKVSAQFPTGLNQKRSEKNICGVQEVIKILNSVNLCTKLKSSILMQSKDEIRVEDAKDQLSECLWKILQDRNLLNWCAVYLYPPYSVLLWQEKDVLLAMDTQPVAIRFGGREKGVVVSTKYAKNAIASLVNWLLQRVTKQTIVHELVLCKRDLTSTNINENVTRDKESLCEKSVFQATSKDNEMNVRVRNENINEAEGNQQLINEFVFQISDAGESITKSKNTLNETPYDDSIRKTNTSLVAMLSQTIDSTWEENMYGEKKQQKIKKTVLHPVQAGKSVNQPKHTGNETKHVKDKNASTSNANVSLITMGSSPMKKKDNVKRINKMRISSNEFDIEKWSKCELQSVDKIPYDIDGLKKYKIKLTCTKSEVMKYIKDGRPWKRWTSSSRKGFLGFRRVFRCEGSYVCTSEECPYLREHGFSNKIHFLKKHSIRYCFQCGMKVQLVACKAAKIVEYKEGENFAIVMHIGVHKCAIKKINVAKNALQNARKQHPELSPVKLANDIMVEIMCTQSFLWADVQAVANEFAVLKWRENMSAEIKTRMPKTLDIKNYEALFNFKKKCDEHDRFLIYRVNTNTSEGSSLVFKTSLKMANIAIDMDKDGESVLNSEYAFLECRYDKCRGYKSVILWAFHPQMRQLMHLAIMDTQEKNNDHLFLFWKTFHEVLQDVSAIKGYKFNPIGFIADEYSDNWNCIRQVFGEQARVVSSEYFFKLGIQRHAKLLNETASMEFTQKADAMGIATTPIEFEIACKTMSEFVTGNNVLEDWYNWWLKRKTQVFKVFKQSLALPNHFAEVNTEHYCKTLLEVCREDVANALRQDAELRLVEKEDVVSQVERWRDI